MNTFLPITETLKPSFRLLKYSWLRWFAEKKGTLSIHYHQNITKPAVFIIGCGRSGTTILGQIFSHHSQVNYLFEPYHLWAAIDKRTDISNLFHQENSCLFMDGSYWNEDAQVRFDRLIKSTRANKQAKLIIEKTPHNALRINYLKALAPEAKFIHIVRDGVDVCHSINRLATANHYQISGKPEFNQWWGVKYAKWKALERDGIAAGYYTQEVPLIDNHLSKGAYEWLVTLEEIERTRDYLGDSLVELRYDDLITQPKSTLKDLCDFLDIELSQSWLNKSISKINLYQQQKRKTIILPPRMCQAFNSFQQQYQFVNRAVCLESDS